MFYRNIDKYVIGNLEQYSRYDDKNRASVVLCIDYIADKGWQTPILFSTESFESQYVKDKGNIKCETNIIAGAGSNGVINIFRAAETVRGLLSECRIKQIPVIDDDLLTECIRSFAKFKKDSILSSKNEILDINIQIRESENGYMIFFADRPVSVNSKVTGICYVMDTNILCADTADQNVVILLDGSKENVKGCINANIFICKYNKVFTPPAPLGSSIYSDIMRDTVICLLENEGMTVEETEYPVADLYDAEKFSLGAEIFVTDIVSGIRSVESLMYCGKNFLQTEGSENSIAETLRIKLFRILSGMEDDFRWILYANKDH